MTTETAELPELPKPDVRCGEYAGPPGEGASENYYTADQMREYALLAVKAERARCARLVDGVCPAASQVDLRKALAAAIRKG